MKNRSWYKSPNCLNEDKRLSYSARNIGRVFFAFCNALGQCRKSYDELARLAHCSRNTAISGVRQLVDAGYISSCNTHYYSEKLGNVRGKNAYCVNLTVLNRGYTMIRRDIFKLDLADAAAVIYVQILIAAGNANRAFPSISLFQKLTGAARSTVCAGLKLLKKLPVLLVQLCLKKNGAFAANSYILVSTAPSKSTGGSENTPKRPANFFIAFYDIIKNAVCKAIGRINRLFDIGMARILDFKVKTQITLGLRKGKRHFKG